MNRLHRLMLAAFALLLLGGAPAVWAAPSADSLSPDEWRTLRLADDYASQGMIEDAVSEYLFLLARHPRRVELREKVSSLIAREMPRRLPSTVEEARPFPLDAFALQLAGAGGKGREKTYRVLTTEAGLAPEEGLQTGPLHAWRFPHIEYGYCWDESGGRWVMKARVHWKRAEDRALAQDALRSLLALWCVVDDRLDRDPTQPWDQPIDLWLAPGGPPGGRAMGRNIYLFAVAEPRPPGEWWRELAHEYGHASLPGIDGFTDTDDPWADGHLGELLFIEWLAGSAQGADWLPWSLKAAEKEAAARRAALMAAAAGPVQAPRLAGTDAAARDYFLGLALRVESAAGPRFLGRALARCPRGRPADFVRAVDALAAESKIAVWGR